MANLEDEDFEEDFEEEPDEAYEFAAEVGEADEDEVDEFDFAVEPTAEAEETPDWLADMRGEADEDEIEEFDFATERTAEAGETPDWLADMQDEEEFEADFESEVDEAFDFSSAIIDEDEAEEELALLNNTVADVKDDTSGYVVDVDSDDMDEEFEFVEASAADMDETPDWLADIDSEEEEADEAYQFSPGTADAWDEGLDEEDEVEEFDFVASSAEEAEETPDWLSDLEISDERATPPAQETPDWLSEIDTSAPPAVYEDETDEETPAWLAELNREEEDEAGYDQFDYAEEVDEEAIIGDEIEPVPAENAPDWLNAMVPGLDVDYEAEEDQPLEQEYIRAEAEKSGKDPFDWLSEMVEEELSHPPEAIPGVSRAARFVFTKPPLWMRTDATQRETSTVMIADDDLEDDGLDFDEIGEDLPPWLSFDDDDDIFES
jgi:hypothetical protein